MASLKKIKLNSLPDNVSRQRLGELLDFLELTEFQRAKIPLFFSNDDGLKNYKIHMNKLMNKVYEENKFTGEYNSRNYINNLPNAVEEAIGQQHRLIDLSGEPNVVLQKLAVCLEYYTYDFEDPGKIYDLSIDVLGRIDDDAYHILMREKNHLDISILKDILQYFEPEYFSRNAQEYGYDIEFRSYKIMKKLISGVKVESEHDESDEETHINLPRKSRSYF